MPFDLLRRVYVEAKRAGRQNEFFMFHLGANERLKRNRAGQVVLQLKSAYRDGTTTLSCRRWNSCSAGRPWCRVRACV